MFLQYNLGHNGYLLFAIKKMPFTNKLNWCLIMELSSENSNLKDMRLKDQA